MQDIPAFRPVPTRRPRSDGWTPARQQDFIAALAACGNVARAARRVGMSMQSAYRLRKRPGADGFVAAWETALDRASADALDLALERAIHGVMVVRTYRGRFTGAMLRHDDRDTIRALTLSG